MFFHNNMRILITMVFASTIIITGLFGLSVETTEAASEPTVTLTRKYEGKWGTSDVSGDLRLGVAFRWSSTNADNCISNGVGGFGTDGRTNGTDWTINEPTEGNSTTYTIICTGDGGMAMDSITVTNQVPAPTVSLFRKHKGQWGEGDLTIGEGDRVDLRWTSTNATGCSATGPGFSASAPSGYDWFIDEPTAGQVNVFTITCTGASGVARDSLSITSQVVADVPDSSEDYPMPTVTLTRKYEGSWGSSDVNGDLSLGVAFRWNSTDADSCSTNEVGGFRTGGNTSGTDWSITEPTEGNSITYAITCTGPGGSAEDSITVTNSASPTETSDDEPAVTTAPAPAPAPVAMLLATVYSNGQYLRAWSTDDFTISTGQQVALAWRGTDLTNCSGIGFTAQGVSGVDWYVAEPTTGNTKTFTLMCEGPGGTAGDMLTVTNSPVPVNLERSLYSAQTNTWSAWSGADVTITAGQQVILRWSSVGATTCSATSGSGFEVGVLNGNDWSVTEPVPGASETYTISCTGSKGAGQDSITITHSTPTQQSQQSQSVSTTPATSALTASLEKRIYSDNSWSAWSQSDGTIKSGDSVQLRWSSTGADECSGRGDGFNSGYRTEGYDWEIDEPSRGQSEIYSIRCTGPAGLVTTSVIITNPSITISNLSPKGTSLTASLEKRIYSDNSWSAWSQSDGTIKSGDSVQLRWSSTGADECSGRGDGFNSGYRTEGYDWEIDEPSRGQSEIYSIRCNGPAGLVTTSVIITNPASITN